MTRISIWREGDYITAISAQGHAGNAAANENIVCAAVSSLMFTAINAVESVAHILPIVSKDDRNTLISVRLPEGCENHDAQVILRTVIQGLTDISQEYPKLVGITTQDGRTNK